MEPRQGAGEGSTAAVSTITPVVNTQSEPLVTPDNAAIPDLISPVSAAQGYPM